jgi:mono/diheme cytochrome c family protein
MTKYVQASCAQCHTDATKWAAIGAPKLARGKQIFEEKNCISCHKLGEEGGNIGPELTFVGDKVPEQFGFEHLKASLEAGTFGEEAKAEAKHLHHDVEAWHRFHFKNPQAVSSGSIMPAFGFSDEDTEALVTYMLSLRAKTIPVSMMTDDAKLNAKAVPAAKKVAAAAPAAAAVAPAGTKVDGKALYDANCASCHQATGAGMAGVFPPLAGAEIPNGDAAEHIKIALHGKSGPMKVLGQDYNGAMPPFTQLSDEEIAAIVNHERTSWGNKGSTVTPAQVKALR